MFLAGALLLLWLQNALCDIFIDLLNKDDYSVDTATIKITCANATDTGDIKCDGVKRRSDEKKLTTEQDVGIVDNLEMFKSGFAVITEGFYLCHCTSSNAKDNEFMVKIQDDPVYVHHQPDANLNSLLDHRKKLLAEHGRMQFTWLDDKIDYEVDNSGDIFCTEKTPVVWKINGMGEASKTIKCSYWSEMYQTERTFRISDGVYFYDLQHAPAQDNSQVFDYNYDHETDPIATETEIIITEKTIIYIFFVVTTILVIALAVFVVIYIKLRQSGKELERALYTRKEDLNLLDIHSTLNEQAHLLPFNKQLEFPRSLLKLGKQLGIGNYGVVYKGEAKSIIRNEEFTTVAVKKSLRMPNTDMVMLMIKELKIMGHVNGHVNIVNLMGAVVDRLIKWELMIIMEFCPYGNMHKYLIKNSFRYDADENLDWNDANYDGNTTNEEMMPFNEKVLISWSYQISRGMSWLASRMVLHGDLAARNILVCPLNIVKISDFGLSSTLYETVYKKKSGSPLPMPWLALESLQTLHFSTQSDVWSYGIVLWEMFTFGGRPYLGMDMPGELTRQLKAGYRLEIPLCAPQHMYDLMLECWRHLPEERPSFEMIAEKLTPFITDVEYFQPDEDVSDHEAM